MRAEEQLARFVHGVAALGGDVEDVLKVSGQSQAVISRAMTYIDPDVDEGPVAWHEVLAVLTDALGRLR